MVIGGDKMRVGILRVRVAALAALAGAVLARGVQGRQVKAGDRLLREERQGMQVEAGSHGSHGEAGPTRGATLGDHGNGKS